MNHWKRLLLGIAAVPIVLVTVFLSTRHMLLDRDPVVEVSERTIKPAWSSPASDPGAARSIVTARPWITNATVTSSSESSAFNASVGAWASAQLTSSGTSRVALKPGPFVRVVQPLATRRVRNVWGVEVLKWDCRIEGAISEDGSEYCFTLLPTGGGDEGHTLRFDGTYDRLARVFTLTVVEKLWRSDARQFDLRFKVDGAGKVSLEDPDRGG